MENNQTSLPNESVVNQPEQKLTADGMLLAIYENTRKTKNYMKWQLYITVALVVVPLLAALAIMPMVLNSLSSVYGQAGLLQ